MSDTVDGVSDDLVDFICQTEESGVCKTQPYLDPGGIPTMGFGSIWDWRTVPKSRVTMDSPPVDENTARQWIRLEFAEASATIRRLVKVPLTSGQRDALLDFIYNEGQGNFETSTLLRKLNAGDYDGADAEFAQWDLGRNGSGVLVVMGGLVKRRAWETGEFAMR